MIGAMGDTEDELRLANPLSHLGLDSCYRNRSRYQQTEKTMNSEQLIENASIVIEFFARDHEGACVLSIKNGVILATPAKEARCKAGSCLYITPWQQRHGLSSRMWKVLGSELLNLYNKEGACHTLPKP